MKEFKIHIPNSTKIQFLSFSFFNVDSSFDISDRLLNFCVVVLGFIMEGTVSQNLYLGPSFCFMILLNLSNVSRFLP